MRYVWLAVKQRCFDTKFRDFHRYGGRGITLHPDWVHDFDAFFAHVGPRPSPKHSLDRIDNDRGYVPGNLRWATQTVQNRNSAQAKLTEMDVRFVRHWLSRGYSGVEVAKAFGVSKACISAVKTGRRWK